MNIFFGGLKIVTKQQIIEAYANDLTIMAQENKRLIDLLKEVQDEKAHLYIVNNDLRKENEDLRRKVLNLLKERSKIY